MCLARSRPASRIEISNCSCWYPAIMHHLSTLTPQSPSAPCNLLQAESSITGSNHDTLNMWYFKFIKLSFFSAALSLVLLSARDFSEQFFKHFCPCPDCSSLLCASSLTDAWITMSTVSPWQWLNSMNRQVIPSADYLQLLVVKCEWGCVPFWQAYIRLMPLLIQVDLETISSNEIWLKLWL